MKEYKVSVYNYIDRFHDEYRVYATNPQTAIKMAKQRIFIETDYDVEDFEILKVERV
jgi:hypothetical protein